MDPISRKVEDLRLCQTANPTHRENIEAIIRYYEAGGQFPIPGRTVACCFDGETVKIGTYEEYGEELLVQKKAGRWDVRGTRLPRPAPLFSLMLTKVMYRLTWPNGDKAHRLGIPRRMDAHVSL